MANLLAKVQGLLEAGAAFVHEGVVHIHADAHALQFHQDGEDVRRAVEERARQHGALDASALGIGLGFERAARLVQAAAGYVDAVFGVVEQAPCQRPDQFAPRLHGVAGRVVGLDPVAVVENPIHAVDQASRAVRAAGVSIEAVVGMCER